MKTMKLNNLFETARRELPPTVDVADQVMARLTGCGQSASATFNRSLMWVSMASSAIAACIVLAAFLTWRNSADSVGEIINAVAWVAQ